MFRGAMTDLATQVVQSARQTVKQYNPFQGGMQQGSALSRVAEQGIQNIQFRSPILADIASTMLHTFQAEQGKRMEVEKFVRSDSPASKEFKEKLREKMDGASDKKIDAEMKKILLGLTKKLEEDGIKETKGSESYKEYGKYLEQVFSELKEEIKEPIKPLEQQDSVSPEGNGTSIIHNDLSGLMESLVKIEYNTNRTVNALEEIATRGGLTGGVGSGGKYGGQTSGGGVYVDPYTGMPSVKGTVGSIASKVISNVFDDKAIDLMSSKLSQIIFGKKKESDSEGKPPTPQPKETETKDIQETLSTKVESVEKTPTPQTAEIVNPELVYPEIKESMIPDVMDQIDTLQVPITETKDIQETLSTKVESVEKTPTPQTAEIVNPELVYPEIKESMIPDVMDQIDTLQVPITEPKELPAKKQKLQKQDPETVQNSIKSILSNIDLNLPTDKESAKEIATEENKDRDTHIAVANDTLTEIKKLNDAKKVESEKGKGGILDTLSDKLSDIVGAGLMGKLGGLATTATGAAQSVGQTILGAGAKALPALGSGAAVLGAGAAGYAFGKYAVNPLIEKGLSAATGRETSLGSLIYDAFNQDEQTWDKGMTPASKGDTKPKIEPVKNTTPQELESKTISKEKMEASKELAAQTQQQILINNTQTTTSGGQNSAQSPTIIVPTSVRNLDSTFDRVQMQNFWSKGF